MNYQQKINQWNAELAGKSPVEVIRFFLAEFGDKVALSSSMGLEDQVLTHMVQSVTKEALIFTLDTGRLFPETYDLIDDRPDS